MKVYKRNGQEVDFALDKIKEAINKANRSTYEKFKEEIIKELTNFSTDSTEKSFFNYDQILYITDDKFDWDNSKAWDCEEANYGKNKPNIPKDKFIKILSKYILVDGTLDKVIETTQKFLKPFDTVTVEDISDIVEKSLMKNNAYEVAKEFITYRNNKKKNKKFTDTEEKVLSVIDGTNEELRGDNANKHIDVNNTARDYIAGTVCKSIAEKILPKHILKAHNKKWIHFHDLDYSPVMHEHNCDVYDLEDMLDNGFCMNDVGITSPKRFSTACNLAAQTNLIISSCQYGGQTLTWTGVAKYIDKTRINSAQTLAKDLLSL